MSRKYEFHPAASIYPLLEGDEYDRMVENIAEHGVKVPIQLCTHDKKKKIIDGRNRYRAAQDAGVECPTIDVTDLIDGDALDHVISLNEIRRHLTITQRSSAAANALILSRKEKGRATAGRPQEKLISINQIPDPESERTLAEKFGVSQASVHHAVTVKEKGSAAISKAIDEGQLSVYAAAQLVDAVPDKKEQTEILKEALETANTEQDTTVGVERSVSKKVNAAIKKRKPKAKKPPKIETVLNKLEESLARPWGVAEQFGSVEEMFNSKTWQKEDNKIRIGEYIALVERLAKAYADLDVQCRKYARKYNIK